MVKIASKPQRKATSWFTRASIVMFMVIIAAAAGLAFLGVRYAFSGSSTQATPQTVPPVSQEPLVQTDLEQVKSAQGLGPFTVLSVNPDTPNPETNYPAVLLLGHDGSTAASTKWTVPFDAKQWNHQDSLLIRSLSVNNGYATFGVGQQRVYTVKLGQPFVFEDQPQSVVVIDAQGQQWALGMSHAIVLRSNL